MSVKVLETGVRLVIGWCQSGSLSAIGLVNRIDLGLVRYQLESIVFETGMSSL